MRNTFEYSQSTYETKAITIHGHAFIISAEANLKEIQESIETQLRTKLREEHGDPSSTDFTWVVSEAGRSGARVVTCNVMAVVHTHRYGASNAYGQTSGIEVSN